MIYYWFTLNLMLFDLLSWKMSAYYKIVWYVSWIDHIFLMTFSCILKNIYKIKLWYFHLVKSASAQVRLPLNSFIYTIIIILLLYKFHVHSFLLCLLYFKILYLFIYFLVMSCIISPALFCSNFSLK